MQKFAPGKFHGIFQTVNVGDCKALNIEHKAITMLGKKFDLENMTLEDLWSLHERMAGILAARIKAEKRELEKRAAILNRSFDKTDLAGNKRSHGERPRRSYPAVLPKYRNPKTSETWSGRGKRPLWLTAAIKSGHKIEEFRINEVGGTRQGQRG